MPQIPFHSNITPMPLDIKKRLLPYSVVKIMTAARVIPNYEKKPDIVAVYWDDDYELLHIKDFQLAQRVADELWKEHIEGKDMLTTLCTLPTGMLLHRKAAEKIARYSDEEHKDKKGVIFIKDTSGCGYWRMVVPARSMDDDKYYIDCAEIGVIYDYLLEYDTIVVQRLHTWGEYYVIEKLKRLGKRVIYDIDDDIFNIPSSNPATHLLGQDQQEAAKAIMELVDVITTPSEVIKKRFGFADKTVVIPNAIDLADGYPVLSGVDATDIHKVTSPDKWRRILWQGSPTHAEDWFECAEAIDIIMENNEDVRCVILGFLPPVLKSFIEDDMRPWWDGRVEFAYFEDIATYIHMCKHLRADIGIAPLQSSLFNTAKSSLKWMEYAAMCMPCVASNVTPYKEVIENGVDGFLASTSEEWIEILQTLLDSPDERLRVVRAARKKIDARFDVKKVVKDWERMIFGYTND